jgi:hypothetical protein
VLSQRLRLADDAADRGGDTAGKMPALQACPAIAASAEDAHGPPACPGQLTTDE